MSDSLDISKVVNQLRTLCADPENHSFIVQDKGALNGLVSFLSNKDPAIQVIAAQAISFLSCQSSNSHALTQNQPLMKYLKKNASHSDKSDLGKLIIHIAIDLNVAPTKPIETFDFGSTASGGYANLFAPATTTTTSKSSQNASENSFDSLFGSSSDSKSVGGDFDFMAGSSFTSAHPLGIVQPTVIDSSSNSSSTRVAGSGSSNLPVSPPKPKKKTVYLKLDGIKHDRDRILAEKQLISMIGVISVSIDSVTNVAVVFGTIEEVEICLGINNPIEYLTKMGEKYPNHEGKYLEVRPQDLAGISAQSMFGQKHAVSSKGSSSSSTLSVDDILAAEQNAQNTYTSALVQVDESSLQVRMRKRRMEKKQQESGRFFDKVARALWAW